MRIKSDLVEAHVFRENNGVMEYLMLKRAPGRPYPDVWQPVTGSLENGETGWQAAIREFREETGMEPLELFVVPKVNSFYSQYTDSVNFVPVFAIRTGPQDKVKLSEEHSEYRWVPLSEGITMVAWEGQKEAMKLLEEYFGKRKSLLKFNKIDLKK